jgi:UDP:flavonoid glycosyltransferase YjiC (YdhE family)
MNILVIATGTRGDVQPRIALGKQLLQGGHRVIVAAQALFSASIAEAGLEIYPLSGDARKFFAGPIGVSLRARMNDGKEFTRFWRAYVSPSVRRHLCEVLLACQDVDAVICEPWFQVAPTLRQILKVPCFVACLTPVPSIPTSQFVYPFSQRLSNVTVPAEYENSWSDADWFASAAFPDIKRWRAELSLETVEWEDYLKLVRDCPHLFGYSSHVLEKPSDWSELHQVTGYWFTCQDAKSSPSEALEYFIQAGSPPIVMGFSSQVCDDGVRIRNCFVRALRNTGRRGILLSGWGEVIQIDSKDCFCCQEAPYEWLLPRVAGMIHHGGAGSVGECLRAGAPSFAIPQGYDGAFWGLRIAALGVGLDPMPMHTLTESRLSDSLHRLCEDRVLKQKLKKVAALIQEETRQAKALHSIEDFIHNGHC